MTSSLVVIYGVGILALPHKNKSLPLNEIDFRDLLATSISCLQEVIETPKIEIYKRIQNIL